jgi:isopropylmalate/homocitrate/citramalate synthase
VHQGAVLRDAGAYEAHPLDQFGVTESEILLGPLSGWNAVHYFLKEIRYYQLDEATARAITAVFKSRVYQLAPGQSPEQVLVSIAETEFGLARLHLPAAASPIVQRLDSPLPPVRLRAARELEDLPALPAERQEGR